MLNELRIIEIFYLRWLMKRLLNIAVVKRKDSIQTESDFIVDSH